MPPVKNVKAGASFTGRSVMVKLFVLKSTPPLVVPPSSCTSTVTVAVPTALVAGVKVRVPPNEMDGWTLNSEGLLTPTTTMFVTVW